MLFLLCIMRLYTGLFRKNHIDTLAGRTVVWLLARTTRGRTNRGISDKVAVPKVGVATVPIRLFRPDALVNEPEGMDMAR